MQQLSQWRIDTDTSKILLDEAFFLQEDRFLDRAQTWVSAFGAHLVSIEIGADRAQVHFQIDGKDWLLQVETLCESAWIEPFSQVSDEQLKNLCDLLVTHTFV